MGPPSLRGAPRGARAERRCGLRAGAPLTSHLLLQVQDDGHGLVQDQQFGLGLLAAQVQLAHAPQLLKSLIDVAHAETLPRVIGHAALLLPLGLLLWGQKVVVLLLAWATGRAGAGGRR